MDRVKLNVPRRTTDNSLTKLKGRKFSRNRVHSLAAQS